MTYHRIMYYVFFTAAHLFYPSILLCDNNIIGWRRKGWFHRSETWRPNKKMDCSIFFCQCKKCRIQRYILIYTDDFGRMTMLIERNSMYLEIEWHRRKKRKYLRNDIKLNVVKHIWVYIWCKSTSFIFLSNFVHLFCFSCSKLFLLIHFVWVIVRIVHIISIIWSVSNAVSLFAEVIPRDKDKSIIFILNFHPFSYAIALNFQSSEKKRRKMPWQYAFLQWMAIYQVDDK